MQRIDNYSLDLLFGNNSNETHLGFLETNRSAIGEIRAMGKKIADKLKDDVATESVKNAEVSNSKKGSFKEAVDKANTKSKEKPTQKKSSDELLIEVNIATTQVLDDIEQKLSFEFESKELTLPESVAMSEYEKDVSDIELTILPFATSYAPKIEVNKNIQENNQGLKLEVLSEIKTNLEDKLEALTLKVAQIDLKNEFSVDEILKLSNRIEELSRINDQVKNELAKISSEDVLSHKSEDVLSHKQDNKLDDLSTQERAILIDSRLEKFIAKYQALRANQESKKSVDNLVQELKKTDEISGEQDLQADSEQIKELMNTNKQLNFRDRIEILETSVESEDSLDLSQEAKVSLNENSGLFINKGGPSNMSGSGHQGSQGNSSQSQVIQALQQAGVNSSKAMSVRTQVIKQSIPMEKLTNFVAEKATQAPQGVKQDIKLLLNPENLGEVELSISKQGNKLDIKLIFANEKSMNQVEHKMNELSILLKSRGFEAKIELGHTNAENSSNTNDQHNANSDNQSFNQAKEEQKDKYLDRPSWLEDAISTEGLSFDEQLQGIIN